MCSPGSPGVATDRADRPRRTAREACSVRRMPIALIRPRMQTLEKWQAQAEQDQVTYSAVGATGSPHLPDGYEHARQSVVVGNGVADFERSIEALRGWRAHRYAGAVLIRRGPGS
jgi:hypothetical protein